MNRIWTFVAASLLVGCGGGLPGLDDDPYGDPADPVICVGDPDSNIVCKKSSEFWDCTTMPNGDVKCTHEQPQSPGGSGTWSCEESGGTITCKSKDASAPPSGDTDWTCTQEGEDLVCTKDAPPPPPGGGSWDCTLDSELNWSCTGTGTAPPGGSTTPPTTPPTTTPPTGDMPPGSGTYDCFRPGTTPDTPGATPDGAWATIVTKKVSLNGTEALYVRVTFNKLFVDNTYGKNSTPYYNPAGKQGSHEFAQLVESDKAEVYMTNAKGDLVGHYAVDYISPSSKTKSGYDCLGVSGGEGAVNVGSASDVLAARSSLDVNLNDYGYQLTVDSPATDASYTPNPQYPKWIFEVWYEVWVKWSVFGSNGPGKVYITGIHASPSRIGQNSIEIVPTPCP